MFVTTAVIFLRFAPWHMARLNSPLPEAPMRVTALLLACALAFFAPLDAQAPGAHPAPASFDLLFRGGRVVDGTGAP